MHYAQPVAESHAGALPPLVPFSLVPRQAADMLPLNCCGGIFCVTLRTPPWATDILCWIPDASHFYYPFPSPALCQFGAPSGYLVCLTSWLVPIRRNLWRKEEQFPSFQSSLDVSPSLQISSEITIVLFTTLWCSLCFAHRFVWFAEGMVGHS